jgi:hypothetical protein
MTTGELGHAIRSSILLRYKFGAASESFALNMDGNWVAAFKATILNNAL